MTRLLHTQVGRGTAWKWTNNTQRKIGQTQIVATNVNAFKWNQ